MVSSLLCGCMTVLEGKSGERKSRKVVLEEREEFGGQEFYRNGDVPYEKGEGTKQSASHPQAHPYY